MFPTSMPPISKPVRTGVPSSRPMSACCSAFECAADQQFNEKKATEELKRYRTKGPRPTTRLLQEGLAHAGNLSGTLLDIGSGIGSLTFGLLERGMTRAVAVDASSAYTSWRAKRLNGSAEQTSVRFVRADFVICCVRATDCNICYARSRRVLLPSYEALLTAALRHAEMCLALSYPRDVWYVRLGVTLENAQRRLAKNSFRTLVTSSWADGGGDSVGRFRAVHQTGDVDVVDRRVARRDR